MRRLLSGTLTLALCGGLAVVPETLAQRPGDDLTVAEYRASLRLPRERWVDKEVEAVAEVVSAQPTSPGTASGFGERVGGTITDFLPWFQFAVDSVSPSDDGKAVVVAFNPVQALAWKLKLTATATEPEPFERLLTDVPDDARPAALESISGDLGDLDDVTWSATLGFQPRAGSQGLKARWGRDPEIYRPLIRELAAGSAEVIQEVASDAGKVRGDHKEYVDQLFAVFKPRQPDSLTFREIRGAVANGALPDFVEADFLEAVAAKERLTNELDQTFGALGLDRLADLIHNQPQLVFDLSYRDPGEWVGQEAFAVSGRAEWGTRNLNSVLRRARRQDPGMTASRRLLSAYRDVVGRAGDPEPQSGWRGTATLSFRRLEELTTGIPFGDSVIDVTVPEVEEWVGKFQVSRFADWHAMTIGGTTVKPRVDLSLELVETDGDDNRQDRKVATLTYDLPVAEGVAIPVTLVYADKAEFRGDPDHELSGHVGLSYKLPGS